MLNSFASLTVCVTKRGGEGRHIARSVLELKTFRILRVCEHAASGATESTCNNLNLLKYRSGTTVGGVFAQYLKVSMSWPCARTVYERDWKAHYIVHQPFVTTAPTHYGDGRGKAGLICESVTFFVPPKCRACHIRPTQIYPRGIYCYKEQGYDWQQVPAVPDVLAGL